AAPPDHALDRFGLALEARLDASVGPVPHPSADPCGDGLPTAAVAEEHALDPSVHDHPSSHGHGDRPYAPPKRPRTGLGTPSRGGGWGWGPSREGRHGGAVEPHDRAPGRPRALRALLRRDPGAGRLPRIRRGAVAGSGVLPRGR